MVQMVRFVRLQPLSNYEVQGQVSRNCRLRWYYAWQRRAHTSLHASTSFSAVPTISAGSNAHTFLITDINSIPSLPATGIVPIQYLRAARVWRIEITLLEIAYLAPPCRLGLDQPQPVHHLPTPPAHPVPPISLCRNRPEAIPGPPGRARVTVVVFPYPGRGLLWR